MVAQRALIVFVTASVALTLAAWRTEAATLEVRPEAATVGAYGLEVLLGPSCASPETVTLGPPDGPLSGVYEACQVVDAAGVQVTTPGATLRAGSLISLGEGFVVASGATFAAELEGSLTGGDRYIEDTSPIAETVYNVHFSILLDQMNLSAGEVIEHLAGYSELGAEEFKVTIQSDGAGLALVLESRHGGGTTQTPAGQEIPLAAGWNEVDVQWLAGAGDGHLLVSVNGAAALGLAALDNPGSLIESIRWGVIGGDVESASGFLHLDAFSSWR